MERGETTKEPGAAAMDEKPRAHRRRSRGVAETRENFGAAVHPVGISEAELDTDIRVLLCNSEPIALAGEDTRSNEDIAWQHARNCTDALEVLFVAAAKAGGGKKGYRLPALMDSFIQWCEGAGEDF